MVTICSVESVAGGRYLPGESDTRRVRRIYELVPNGTVRHGLIAFTGLGLAYGADLCTLVGDGDSVSNLIIE